MEKQKLLQKTWFIILLLVILFPVGLYLMWKNKKFNKTVRIGITIIVSIIFISYLGDNPDSQTTTANDLPQVVSTQDTKEAEQTSRTKETINNQTADTPIQNITEEETAITSKTQTKQQAQTVDDNDKTIDYDGKSYQIIEVDGGDLSGERQPNVAVDIGFGDRVYWAFTNKYGQLVNVIADKIILQNDNTESVTSEGRYYSDEAKVPGTEQKDLDEGHVIADSLGGVSNAYNITPQNSTLNRYGDQAYMEKVIRDAGGCEKFMATITYPNTKTQIPSHYHYEYVLKGKKIIDDFDNVNSDEENNNTESQTSKTTESTKNTDTSINEKEELAKIDTNGNGKVTISEAKAAGYKMPIYKDNWLYKYMQDNDHDGMVGE